MDFKKPAQLWLMVFKWVAISQNLSGPAFLHNILAYLWGRRSASMIWAELDFQEFENIQL